MRSTILATALRRLLVSIAVGAVAALVMVLTGGAWPMALMVGITVLATVFAAAGVAVLWPMDAEETDRNARRQDLSPLADEVLVVATSLGGLAGIVALLVMGGARASALPAAVALVGVFMCWADLHVMYASRYAYTFYDVDHPGGIDFNTAEDPCYRDFFYLSFAVGMTYGVTDSGVSTTDLRAMVMRHSIMSFVFGAVILATAINLVTSTFT